ncbi:LolA-like putative outer membrane lipoprotein chaperone [Bacteroides sp.]|uniref:LolA-like putative outer membrane lipoprotein chaperone n=1 Tax=Bacteroides sp. TaxID=29523 RepID=UPI002FCA9C31
MMKYIISILIAFFALPLFAQQQKEARTVLDKTAATFEKAGGVKADFRIKVFSKGRQIVDSGGAIQLKGEKFLLKTPDVTTWFDGKTQWSYLDGSDEVNVSTPTAAELQSMNPYALLYLYQKGFSYRLGSTKVWLGKSVYEVILTATNKQQELTHIKLYIAKDSYQPMRIDAEMRDKTRSEITITSYQAGLNYTDNLFVFNKKQYPNAEIIDLR